MRVLGVDPGTVITGWGVIESDGGRLRYVASGVIEAGRGEVAARLAFVYAEVCGVIGLHAPDVMSLERNFLSLNVQSAFRLGEARGVAMAAAAGAGVPLCEYTPAMIKKTVVGHGRADKAAVAVAVARLLQLARALRADEADALAAAACHGFRSPFASKLAAALRASGARPKQPAPVRSGGGPWRVAKRPSDGRSVAPVARNVAHAAPRARPLRVRRAAVRIEK